MQSNEDYSSNIVTADDHRNISTPDETTPLTQSSPHIYCRYFSPRCFGLIGYSLSLLLLAEVVTFILSVTYFWLTALQNDSTHGGQASNENFLDDFTGDAAESQRKLKLQRKRNVSCILYRL